MEILITPHAIERFRERVPCASDDAARAQLDTRAVRIAAEFGARVVRIPAGRIILQFTPIGAVVITVKEVNGHLPWQLLPHSTGGPPSTASEMAGIRHRAEARVS